MTSSRNPRCDSSLTFMWHWFYSVWPWHDLSSWCGPYLTFVDLGFISFDLGMTSSRAPRCGQSSGGQTPWTLLESLPRSLYFVSSSPSCWGTRESPRCRCLYNTHVHIQRYYNISTRFTTGTNIKITVLRWWHSAQNTLHTFPRNL